jgi:Ubiquitin carboxyl-terminal hydrolase
MMKDAHIIWALRSYFARGNADNAYEFLLILSDSSEFIIRDYDAQTKLLGSENREGVTCYLDSVLFSIFAKLDSFEAMLLKDFPDRPRARLGLLLRVWVNLLRSGKLITAEFAVMIQMALSECGWQDAAQLRQQDASEAFTFITGRLELPLLTLKMDIYHTGKEDEDDDHKYINERLLDVAIPELEDGKGVTLEDCLEEYFNNRIEVRRYLERRATLQSTKSREDSKMDAVHVESIELDWDASPLSGSPSNSSSLRPSNRHRAPSIIQERYLPDRSESDNSTLTTVDSKQPLGRIRKGSVRREVVMPAWQFFSLIPWYTDNAPSSDAQVATHFSTKRPVLGICLKRYSVDSRGKATRLGTKVDIPIEIGLPHFIQDDSRSEDAPLFGNFKLSLQSVVCHRGNSVNAGHYIAFAKSTSSNFAGTVPGENSSYWLRFDDLATHARVTLADIQKSLDSETPYLLFYQIVPIDGDPGNLLDKDPSEARDSGVSGLLSTSPMLGSSCEPQPTSGRPSFEVGRDGILTPPGQGRRTSIAFVDSTTNSITLQKPSAESRSSRLSSRQSSPAGRQSRSLSRTASRSNEGIMRTLSKLAGNRSKEALPPTLASEMQAQVDVHEVPAPTTAPQEQLRNSSIQAQKSIPAHGKHRRDRSKNRLNKQEKPDRECVVM